MTPFPANGLSFPCCPACAEFNAQGCPGTSPHCCPDRFARADSVGEHLARLVDEYAAEVRSLVETYVGRPDRDDLIRNLEDHQYAAAHGINSVREVAADARSLSRHLRVTDVAA